MKSKANLVEILDLLGTLATLLGSLALLSAAAFDRVPGAALSILN